MLDRKSGAAQSVRAQLKALARAGWQAHALTMTLFDGPQEYPLAQVHPDLSPLPPVGSIWVQEDEGVTHTLYVTHSTVHQTVRPWALRAFLEVAQQSLTQLQPDVVLTYSSPMLQPLLAQAQQQGARTVFYLANPSYASAGPWPFRFVDTFLLPSQALVDLYRKRLAQPSGVLLALDGSDALGTPPESGAAEVAQPSPPDFEAVVLRDLVQQHMDGQRNLAPGRVAQRKAQRFVTLVNPDPAKGGQFFLNLVEQARVLAPDVRFRAVESRWGRDEWASHGIPAAVLDRVDWLPHTDDMGRVFEETAILLVPSLWFEASARVVAEALLAGVPVLAMRSGGIEEQLNKGGILFDPPPALQVNHLAAPEMKDLHQWVHFIRVLMDDDALYTQAVQLALTASALHQPARSQAAALAIYDAMARQPLLQSLSAQPDMQQQLAAQRQRMNALRESINVQQSKTASMQAWKENGNNSPYAPLFKQSLSQPAIREAMQAVKVKDLDRARAILEQYLRLLPEDITALGLLAEVADRQEREVEARRLMERVVALAPGFMQGHQQLLRYLRAAGDAEAALVHSFARLEHAPHHARYLGLHAGLLVQANRFEEALAVYQAYFRQQPGTAQDWMQYALALKTLGQQEPAVAAYRKAIELAPGLGAAWHALSNMKLAVFTPADVAAMAQQLARTDLSAEDRYNIHFTLGKAHEDQKAYAPSFEHYAQANGIRRSQSDYDVSRLEDYVAQAKETLTAAFFAERQEVGNQAIDPVFVLGLHRAGSTLTEQILASHSQVEGTRELPDMLTIGREFGGMGPRSAGRLSAGLLTDLRPAEWAVLGQQYLDSSRQARHTHRPLFVDKMPANWMYTGLIHLMLPRAKIIDIRRQPMAAGFALFKMNFGRGVDHSYDQRDIARYYRAYADLMAHFDMVLPGRVHHIQYESLVENTESEIRRLVEYCGLPFESACLRYWETERAVQTPSSEQVRQPIYKGSVEVWRHYAEWLQPMREAFGDLI
ncbi:sulfotransferase [Limnohabitans sp. WS1]|uniref:sulfotransferase n=1 Tax=Limnohabitans sp. WS1 TaxID=1100726 RepID=UPI0013050281|nr:sulfotransferase [Limnohabitans sp. WS1]